MCKTPAVHITPHTLWIFGISTEHYLRPFSSPPNTINSTKSSPYFFLAVIPGCRAIAVFFFRSLSRCSSFNVSFLLHCTFSPTGCQRTRSCRRKHRLLECCLQKDQERCQVTSLGSRAHDFHVLSEAFTLFVSTEASQPIKQLCAKKQGGCPKPL